MLMGWKSWEVMGSIGILLLAKERGIIKEVKPLLNLLAMSDVHLSPNVIEKALELADEHIDLTK